MKISHHAKQRASERLDVNRKFERDKLFKRALRYGHPISEFAGDFENYLSGKKRARNTGVKVYDGNVYIYRNQTVITVFPVPEKYLPIEEHYASYIKNNPLLMKLYEVVDKKDVVLELVTKDANGYIYGLCIEDMFENFGVGQTEIKARNSAIRAYLKRNGYLEEGEENGK